MEAELLGQIVLRCRMQNAIANANANDEIWVKQGNYPVSSTLLVSLSNISIYGGFAGNETALNQRDWTNNTTVFNGQNTVKIMRFSSNNGIIDGIHFRNGFVTGTVDTTNDGGGALRLPVMIKSLEIVPF